MTKTKRTYLRDLHKEHKKWLTELKLYDDEMVSYELKLEEIAVKNTNQEILAELDQLVNALIIHKDKIDHFIHDIEKHEESLANYAKDNIVALNRKYFDDHPELREEVETERKLFNDLKEKIKDFLAKTM